jgi:plastocyanin
MSRLAPTASIVPTGLRSPSLAALAALALSAAAGPLSAEDGAITGTIKVKVPEGWQPPVLKFEKDKAECCREAKGNPGETSPCAGKDGLPDDTLIVSKDGGLANVVVWLSAAPEGGKRDWTFLKATPDQEVDLDKKQVTFDQKFCRFKPHVLLVPKGWNVLLANQDNAAHNVHTFPFAGEPLNLLIQAAKLKPDGTSDRIQFGPVTGKTDASETTPVKVQCDIHSWMTGRWVIMDHPYYAITDANGKFTIDKIPPGKYVLKSNHERFGNKFTGKGLEIEVKAGQAVEVEGFKTLEVPK